MALPPRHSSSASDPDDSSPEVAEQARLLHASGLMAELLDVAPLPALVLNEDRRTIYCNSAFRKLRETPDEDVLGGMIGNALGCRWAERSPDGCGTGSACRLCGGLSAIENVQPHETYHDECRVVTQKGRTFEFDVEVTRRPLGEGTCTVVFLKDNSAEKQRRMVERIFFHDVLNTAGAIHSFTDMLINGEGDTDSMSKSVHELSSRLIDEIRAQQQLVRAEEGTLRVQLNAVAVTEILAQVAQGTPTSSTYSIEIQSPPEALSVKTDTTLLHRVINNMVKNACEASYPGETIVIGANQLEGKKLEFFVQNRCHIPPEVQAQIFERTFSTKDRDRGHGTYSMKLLGEHYLGGEVGFTSTHSTGTRFYIRLPRHRKA